MEHTPGLARSLYGLALVYRTDNNLDEAGSHFLEAYQLFSALGMIRAMGHCLNGLGEVARFQDNPQLARTHYNDAVSLYLRVGLESDGAKSQTNLGILARDAGDLYTAQLMMEEALKVAERDDYYYLAVSIALNLCWVYALQGEDERCQVLLRNYLIRIEENPVLDPDIARPLEGIADLLNNRGQMKEAQALYTTVLDMWEKFHRHHDASRVAAHLD
jgi:tetratricopeptide (TPR) repeat protein